MKGLVFAKRTIKEILREPLSYIFCLGFPLLMLLLMSVLNESLPKEAGMPLFALENLAPGTVYFGLTFTKCPAILIPTDVIPWDWLP